MWVWWDCFSICHSQSKYNEEKTSQVEQQPYPVRDYHTLSLYAKHTCLTLTVAESVSLTPFSCLSRCCLSHCSHSCTLSPPMNSMGTDALGPQILAIPLYLAAVDCMISLKGGDEDAYKSADGMQSDHAEHAGYYSNRM